MITCCIIDFFEKKRQYSYVNIFRNMTDQKITNEMLYELIRDFKGDVNRRFSDIDRRFEHAEKSMEEFKTEVNRRFEHVEKNIEDFKVETRTYRTEDRHAQERMQYSIDRLDHSRDKVKVQMNWDYALKATALNAFLLLIMVFILQWV